MVHKDKNTKNLFKKTVCKAMNFGSTKLTKQKKKNLETQQNGTIFS